VPFAVPDGIPPLGRVRWSRLDPCREAGYERIVRCVAALLNEMLEEGVLVDYAVFGAVAQMRYTEATATMDADVLVAVSGRGVIDLLGPIYNFCARRGYHPEGEAVRVGDWPVQFIPAFSPLTEEAMREAEIGDLDGTPLRVVSAAYLAVIALSVGRAKDFARVLSLLESGATSRSEIEGLATRHALHERWCSFRGRFLDA
jgi:hypothetical protein